MSTNPNKIKIKEVSPYLLITCYISGTGTEAKWHVERTDAEIISLKSFQSSWLLVYSVAPHFRDAIHLPQMVDTVKPSGR